MNLYYSIDDDSKPFMEEAVKELQGYEWDQRILQPTDVLLVSKDLLIPWIEEKKRAIDASLKKGGSLFFFPPFAFDKDLGALLLTRKVIVKKIVTPDPSPILFSKEMKEFVGEETFKGKASYCFQTVPSTGLMAMLGSDPIIVGFRRMNGEGHLIFCGMSLLMPDMTLSSEDRRQLITAMMEMVRVDTDFMKEEREEIFPELIH